MFQWERRGLEEEEEEEEEETSSCHNLSILSLPNILPFEAA
jgi:hypothetical protein